MIIRVRQFSETNLMNSHTIAVLVENIVVESHSIFSFSRNTDIFPRFLAVCGEKIL